MWTNASLWTALEAQSKRLVDFVAGLPMGQPEQRQLLWVVWRCDVSYECVCIANVYETTNASNRRENLRIERKWWFAREGSRTKVSVCAPRHDQNSWKDDIRTAERRPKRFDVWLFHRSFDAPCLAENEVLVYVSGCDIDQKQEYHNIQCTEEIDCRPKRRFER